MAQSGADVLIANGAMHMLLIILNHAFALNKRKLRGYFTEIAPNWF
jgi:hypothetical protein